MFYRVLYSYNILYIYNIVKCLRLYNTLLFLYCNIIMVS